MPELKHKGEPPAMVAEEQVGVFKAGFRQFEYWGTIYAFPRPAPVFQTLEDSAVSQWLNSLLWGFPVAEIFHIAMTGGFFGGILMLDLRLLGFGRNVQVSQLLKHTIPVLWLLFLGVIASGALLFLFMPLEYASNIPFRLKLALIAVGGVNALVMHLVLMRRQYIWDVHAKVPGSVKLAALLSIIVWVGALACGRLIAYYYGV